MHRQPFEVGGGNRSVSFRSERQAQRELLHARVRQRGAIRAEAAVIRSNVNRIGIETNGVCDVENFPGEFQRHAFIDLPGLRQAGVDSKEALAAERIAAASFSWKRKTQGREGRGRANGERGAQVELEDLARGDPPPWGGMCKCTF